MTSGGSGQEADVVSHAAVAIAALLLAVPALAADDKADKEGKGKRPGLEMRASPRYSFSPARILFTAELKGGDDVEELYCPEVEWEWGDGGRSVEEADCEPWAPGTKLERRFTGTHVYPNAGNYLVRVTLRKSGRSVTTQTMSLTVRAGLGDPSPDPGD
jgi:hypothetical protein